MISLTFLVISGLLLLAPAIRQRIEDRSITTTKAKAPRKRSRPKKTPKE